MATAIASMLQVTANVRYLYDEVRGWRLKTVELIIDETPWRAGTRRPRPNDHDLIGVRIAWEETDLRIAAKKADGIRRARRKLWEISWNSVRPRSGRWTPRRNRLSAI